MTMSPMPFLRLGFLILALGIAAAVAEASTGSAGWMAWVLAGAIFLAVAGLGEWLCRRLPPAVR
jgi:hypothetical protein